MTAPLRRALVRRPGRVFATAFEDPALGFLRPVDLDTALREHDALVDLLTALGVDVTVIAEGATPDSLYPFDPLLISDAGAIRLRSGKPNRIGEEDELAQWCVSVGIPTVGAIQPPGTVDGGDTFWLRPDLLVIGRSLRTNESGARQLAAIAGGEVRTFDVPYWHGPAECLHLLSVISPVADDLAVVYRPLVPAGLWSLLGDLGIRTIAVPDQELDTLGCNVLATAPGVVVVAEGNPVTASALAAAGCDVHATRLDEIGVNGSGGPTCLVRPVLRA
jgi:dimethylargininase